MKKISVLFITIFLLSFSSGYSQYENVDLNQLIRETQKNKGESGEINLIWWIPVEFWATTFSKEKSLSKEEVNEFLEVLSPYIIFAVIDGDVGPFGGISYTPFDTIRNNLVLTGKDKTQYYPMNYDELNSDVSNLLHMFKPIIKNIMGQLGENMHFFVFTDIDNNNNRIADPYKKGFIEIKLSENNFKWRTPIGALLPLKICPKDGEKMNGAWEYCPWHGKKLVEDK